MHAQTFIFIGHRMHTTKKNHSYDCHFRVAMLQDEEKELLLELARIRKEREQEAAKKAAEDEKSKQLALQEEVMHGNPLHARAQADFQVGLFTELAPLNGLIVCKWIFLSVEVICTGKKAVG